MTRKPLLVLCTLACTVLAGCPDDLPVIPQWDADWALPLPTQSIPLDSSFGGITVPPNTSFPIDFPVQQQPLDQTFSTLDLGERLRPGSKIVLTIGKAATTALSIVDTIFVGESSTALNATDPRTIRLRVDLASGATASTDTITITTANLDMIQDVARFGGFLFVQARGVASSGAAGYTFTGTEVLTVRAQIIARVAIAK